VDADRPAGGPFQPFQVRDAAPQQALALPGLDRLVVEGVEQVEDDEGGLGRWRAFEQREHLVADEGARDRDALQHLRPPTRQPGDRVGIEAVAAIQDANRGALPEAGNRGQHGSIQAARAHQQDEAAWPGLQGAFGTAVRVKCRLEDVGVPSAKFGFNGCDHAHRIASAGIKKYPPWEGLKTHPWEGPGVGATGTTGIIMLKDLY